MKEALQGTQTQLPFQRYVPNSLPFEGEQSWSSTLDGEFRFIDVSAGDLGEVALSYVQDGTSYPIILASDMVTRPSWFRPQGHGQLTGYVAERALQIHFRDFLDRQGPDNAEFLPLISEGHYDEERELFVLKENDAYSLIMDESGMTHIQKRSNRHYECEVDGVVLVRIDNQTYVLPFEAKRTKFQPKSAYMEGLETIKRGFTSVFNLKDDPNTHLVYAISSEEEHLVRPNNGKPLHRGEVPHQIARRMRHLEIPTVCVPHRMSQHNLSSSLGDLKVVGREVYENRPRTDTLRQRVEMAVVAQGVRLGEFPQYMPELLAS